MFSRVIKKFVLIPMDVDLRIYSFLNGCLHSKHKLNYFKEVSREKKKKKKFKENKTKL